MPKLSNDEFQAFSKYIHDISGIFLDNGKSYLIENRFAGLIREHACDTYGMLCAKAKNDPTHQIQRQLIDAITTGETFFFRDNAPFDLLQHKILPDLIDRRARMAPPGRPPTLRIWSAACSTGQEVYSIAIVLKEMLGDLERYNIRLVGTDISDQAVAQASRGIFNRIEIERGLPKEKLDRYFTPVGETWKVRDEIRGLATFRQINLMNDFAALGTFDIIFCRNVAIYFNESTRTQLFTRLGRSLERDGSLILGATESLIGICPQFESKRYLRSVFYQLKP